MEKQTISNLGQAVSVLVQAAEMAQTKGVYALKDSALIFEAISFIDEVNKANQPQGESAPTEGEVSPKVKKMPKGPTD